MNIIVTSVGPDGRFGVMLDRNAGKSFARTELVAEFSDCPLHRRLAARFVADLAREVLADEVDCEAAGLDFATTVLAALRDVKIKVPA